MNKTIFLMLILFTLAFLSAGCTSFESSEPLALSKDAVWEPVMYEGESDENTLFSVPSPQMAAGYADRASKRLQVQDQKIIKTANIKIEVANVTASAEEVKEIAGRYDGLIQSLSVYAGTKNSYTGSVTIRVPAEYFDDALAKISAIGRVLSSSVSAEDVTEEYVDLEAQRDSLSNQLTQYNRLLSRGQNVTEILVVQKEIERVQLELDRIFGRMKYLDNRIMLSTISVSLSEPLQVETPEGYSIPGVISEGIAGFVDTVVWLFIAILTLLPVLILAGAGYWVYQRRVKNRQG